MILILIVYIKTVTNINQRKTKKQVEMIRFDLLQPLVLVAQLKQLFNVDFPK